MYYCNHDLFNPPLMGIAGRTFTNTCLECLNLSSYNYLGFADSQGPCTDAVKDCIQRHGMGIVTSQLDAGSLAIHLQLESIVAHFVGAKSAMCTSMGFATNSNTIPALVGKESLIVSDELNHSSIVFGMGVSEATIRVCKHNNIKDLETVLHDAISQGQPCNCGLWKKILVIVKGLSMEGRAAQSQYTVDLKKKYKFFLYVNKAHSMCALGPYGCGICDVMGIDPAKDVDVMMGTFTKSFGSAGGCIAGKKTIIDNLQTQALSHVYGEPISPPMAQQIILSICITMGEDGTTDGQDRIARLWDNSTVLRNKLKRMGFIVYRDEETPVLPAFSRECLDRGIVVVVVGHLATPTVSCRVRFCISVSHSREDIENLNRDPAKELGDKLGLKVS
ncbi:PLP-dependent transferase [Gonapodya prolifera JEL478]|uniref:serine C-palmitoyltransferase n=1 Tax=Gonapodya prolifera (strain JEL478) TaxID=1344416 RepID=A0A139ABW0_GONPJ|nr:PLP-dependent transferase [Gonapodya prolifera JEL478]|eukprot:KXS14286.1 PLP-dependent transferase [Gonapodya prolifera JEL478]